jgi:hypothetical protein
VLTELAVHQHDSADQGRAGDEHLFQAPGARLTAADGAGLSLGRDLILAARALPQGHSHLRDVN